MNDTNAMLDRITSLLEAYEPSAETKQLVHETPTALLVGISGAGKDTIKHRLLETGKYHHIVSHTTRKPRENKGVMEEDGVEYHFIPLEESQRMLEAGEYIEGNIYSGNVYGTSISEIKQAKREGLIAITDMDVNGVANYKKHSQNVIAMFILPPNFEEWQHRLLARYGGRVADPADMEKRMHTAIAELEHALETSYYHFIVNEDLEQAVHAADSIAHNHNRFNEIDKAVRQQAEALLNNLRRHVA